MFVNKNFSPVYNALLELKEIPLKVATKAYVKAKDYVPVDTGRLKKSIHISTNPSASGGNKYSVYTNQSYAKYIEYGSSTNRATPFMKKASLDAEVTMLNSLTDIQRRLR